MVLDLSGMWSGAIDIQTLGSKRGTCETKGRQVNECE